MRMTKCYRLKIPEKACYIEFKKEKVVSSKDIGRTNRKEVVIIDYNKKDEIIGIELVGDKKLCQDTN